MQSVNADGSRAAYTHPQRIEEAAEISNPTTNDPEIVKEAIDSAVEIFFRCANPAGTLQPLLHRKTIQNLHRGTWFPSGRLRRIARISRCRCSTPAISTCEMHKKNVLKIELSLLPSPQTGEYCKRKFFSLWFHSFDQHIRCIGGFSGFDSVCW
jgi:hypothetical protein